ncbi:MAG: hypothetical protein EBT09_10055, partial [Actinobacteria bacterium]|nr:hypothetical protein [Actinomycetota bacterium]
IGTSVARRMHMGTPTSHPGPGSAVADRPLGIPAGVRNRTPDRPIPVLTVPRVRFRLLTFPMVTMVPPSLSGAVGKASDRLKFIPDIVVAYAIATEIADEPDDLDTWEATLGKWATATKAGGGANHHGPNALPALFEQLTGNRKARRDKIDATLRKAMECRSGTFGTRGMQSSPDVAPVESHAGQLEQPKVSRPAVADAIVRGTSRGDASRDSRWSCLGVD